MMFETPSVQSKESSDKEKRETALNDAIEKALDNLAHYKEMPDVNLVPDEDGSYSSQDPAAVEAKRANKYRKVAFGTITNYLYLIVMQLQEKNMFSEKLIEINDEIALAERVTKDMIDRFDALAYEIIGEGKKELNKE